MSLNRDMRRAFLAGQIDAEEGVRQRSDLGHFSMVPYDHRKIVSQGYMKGYRSIVHRKYDEHMASLEKARKESYSN